MSTPSRSHQITTKLMTLFVPMSDDEDHRWGRLACLLAWVIILALLSAQLLFLRRQGTDNCNHTDTIELHQVRSLIFIEKLVVIFITLHCIVALYCCCI